MGAISSYSLSAFKWHKSNIINEKFRNCINFFTCILPDYRVSHSKVWKVILLWWGYTFRFFLSIRGPMCSWETHIFAYHTSFYWNNVLRHLWSNLQTCKLFWGEKEYECIKCKGTFKHFLKHFWLLYALLVKMTACTLGIELFCWHQEPKWPQWPQ